MIDCNGELALDRLLARGERLLLSVSSGIFDVFKFDFLHAGLSLERIAWASSIASIVPTTSVFSKVVDGFQSG